MIGRYGDSILNQTGISSGSCTSSHGTSGFLEGTVFDDTLGVYICPCGRQYQSSLQKPEQVNNIKSFIHEGATEMLQGYTGPSRQAPFPTDEQAASKSLDWPNGHPA